MTTTQIPETVERNASSWRPLARHYVEMVVAMFVGMLVLGGLRAVARPDRARSRTSRARRTC